MTYHYANRERERERDNTLIYEKKKKTQRNSINLSF